MRPVRSRSHPRNRTGELKTWFCFHEEESNKGRRKKQPSFDSVSRHQAFAVGVVSGHVAALGAGFSRPPVLSSESKNSTEKKDKRANASLPKKTPASITSCCRSPRWESNGKTDQVQLIQRLWGLLVATFDPESASIEQDITPVSGRSRWARRGRDSLLEGVFVYVFVFSVMFTPVSCVFWRSRWPVGQRQALPRRRVPSCPLVLTSRGFGGAPKSAQNS